MLTKQMAFLTTTLLLTLSLLACNGLAAPTPAPSTNSAGQTLKVVTFTEEPAAAPIEPIAMPVTGADTQAVSLNEPAKTSILPPTPAPTTQETLAIAEPASLTTELVAKPRHTMNIRQGPGAAYPVIGSAAAGQSFTITGRNEAASWLQISSEAIAQGWLYAEIVEISGDALTAPVVQADDIPHPPAESETQFVVSTVEGLAGTIYFIVDDNSPAGGIYKISADGTNLIQIKSNADGYDDDLSMALSPDGQRLALSQKKELVGGLLGTYFDSDIYIMNIDGTGLVNLTHSPDLYEGGVGWLPDGQRLVCGQSYDSAKQPPGKDTITDIYVLDINQGTSLNLTHNPPGRHSDSVMSPDGQKIVFSTRPSRAMGPPPPGMNYVPDLPETLSVMNLDGSGRVDLIDMPPGYELGASRWSPDSQRIALTVGVQQEDGGYIYDVHLLNPDGTQHVNITNTPDAWESKPAWSPDGQRLAVSCNFDRGGVYSKSEMTGLQFFSRAGLAQSSCLDLPNTYAATNLKWSPDGQRVAIFGERWQVDGNLLSTSQRALFTINANGTDLIQITNADLDAGYDFSWSPGGQWLVFSTRPRISGTGAFAAGEGVPDVQHKIYVSRADGSDLTPLTEGHPGWIDDIEWRP